MRLEGHPERYRKKIAHTVTFISYPDFSRFFHINLTHIPKDFDLGLQVQNPMCYSYRLE